MDIFGVTMLILYRERSRKSFQRLQLEVMRMIPDETLFAWQAHREESGLLAHSVANFSDSGAIVPYNQLTTGFHPCSMSNVGLSIAMYLHPHNSFTPEILVAYLRCWTHDTGGKCFWLHIYFRIVFEVTQEGDARPIFRRTKRSTAAYIPVDQFEGYREDVYVLGDEQMHHMTFDKGGPSKVPESQIWRNHSFFPCLHNY